MRGFHPLDVELDLPDVVGFVVENVLDPEARVLGVDDERWLARLKAQDLIQARADLRARMEALALPAPASTLDDLVRPLEAQLGARLTRHHREQLLESAQLDGDGRLLALGDSRRARVLALLRGAAEPLHMDDLERAVEGRFGLPEEVLHFGKGRVGLRQHIPDFETWRARLVPRAAALVRELGPERQWSTGELLDELREEQDLPEWLTPWVLGALIKAGSELTYLGRLRVTLPGALEGESRLFVHDALEQLLQEAGEPLPRDTLVDQARARVSAPEITLQAALNRPQFVRLDADLVGLLERDVPGAMGAVEEAVEHAESLLARRGRGLSSHHLHAEVALLSDAHARWSEELTVSVLRGDGRFRFSQSGAVGLGSWESTRMPTRLELTRSALAEGGGRVTVEAVMSRIEANYGGRPTRATVAALGFNLGAVLDGQWLVRKAEEEPA